MNQAKENKKSMRGITLIPLLITVALMLILTGVALRSGLQSAENAELQAFFAELQIVQKRVDVITQEAKAGQNKVITYDTATKQYNSKIGKAVKEITEENEKAKIDQLIENEVLQQEDLKEHTYYYYTPSELKELGIEEISQDILINWKTRDVVSVDGIIANGIGYYRDPSVQKTTEEEQTREIVLTEDNIEITGEAIKQIAIVDVETEDKQELKDFEVRYRLKEENEKGWSLAKGHQFKTAIPGTYEIRVSRNQIESNTIEITLEPEFKVEQKQVADKWQYTITQIFGEYQYKNVAYQYRETGDTEWTNITGDTFTVLEQKEYEIQAIDMESEEKTVIGRITSTIL